MISYRSQYRFDPHTGAWENRYFSAEKATPPFSLHDVTYDEIGVVMKTTRKPRDYDVKLEVSESSCLYQTLLFVISGFLDFLES